MHWTRPLGTFSPQQALHRRESHAEIAGQLSLSGTSAEIGHKLLHLGLRQALGPVVVSLARKLTPSGDRLAAATRAVARLEIRCWQALPEARQI